SVEGRFIDEAQKAVNTAIGFNPFGGLPSRGQTNVLEFPMDVASGDAALGNHGHYIMFYINEQDKAQLSMSDRGSGGSIADNLATPYNIPSHVREYTAKFGRTDTKKNNGVKNNVNADVPTDQLVAEFFGDEQASVSQRVNVAKRAKLQKTLREDMAAGGSTVRVKRAPTKRLATSIAMYMPQSVQVTYGAQYQDTTIGAVTEGALNAYNDLISDRGSEAIGQLKQISTDVADSLQTFLLSSIGVIPGLGGVREVSEMKSGNVIADRLELAFKGINKRNFQYTFKMTPKDRREVEMIRKIIFAFKSNMMPEFVGGNRGGRRLLVPNTFDIAYMYTGNQNLHLHNISTCV
ncbi:MAG: hypothetical protein VYA01_02405, partial [Bacteroidota bacterium]|nr:hypothetical protein [Bacteroidota bacterium]